MKKMPKKNMSLLLIAIISTASFIGIGTRSFAEESLVNRVTVTFNGDATTSKGINWYSEKEFTGSNVQAIEILGIGRKLGAIIECVGESFESSVSSENIGHRVVLNNLNPGARYYYRVGDKSKNVWSEVGILDTASTSDEFSFISLSDTQAESSTFSLPASTMEKAVSKVSNSQFILHSGDVVDYSDQESQWINTLGAAEDIYRNTTVAPASGNHDRKKGTFDQHFNLSGKDLNDTSTGTYYSFSYGSAHFIVLNTNESSTELSYISEEQLNWLKIDAREARESGAKWLIINMHKGPYTVGAHSLDGGIVGSAGIREKLTKVFEELDIDIVFQGHDHIYSRALVNGVLYICPGTAGPKMYSLNNSVTQDYMKLFLYNNGQEKELIKRKQNFVGVTVNEEEVNGVCYEIDKEKKGNEPFEIDGFKLIK